MSATLVDMLNHALQQTLVLVRIEGFHVVLPPDLRLDLRPCDGEGVVYRAPGAGGVGVEDQRTVDAEPGGKSLLRGVGAIHPDTTAIVLDRLVKELILRQIVLVGDGSEPELLLERVAKIHRLSPLRDA